MIAALPEAQASSRELLLHRASSLADHARSIQRAVALPVPEHLAHQADVQASASVRALVDRGPEASADHVREPERCRPQAKLHAHNALRRVAHAVDSSNIRRRRKAR